jgi:hypothetical protein
MVSYVLVVIFTWEGYYTSFEADTMETCLTIKEQFEAIGEATVYCRERYVEKKLSVKELLEAMKEDTNRL